MPNQRPRYIVTVALAVLFGAGAVDGAPQAPAKPATKPTKAAPAQNKAPVAAPSTESTTWTGDLDGMLQRRRVRFAVAYSKSEYYIVKGTQYGAVYEAAREFERYLNQKYPPKTKNLRIHVIFFPVSRDQLLSRVVEGKADLAAAGMTITPERRKIVDFSDPTVDGVHEIAVTGPSGPQLATLDDLAGKDVYLRKTSSYWEHVERLNEQFKKDKKQEVKLHAVPDDLEDEDLLEMVNAGLIPTIIVDRYKGVLWSNLYKKLQVHEGVAVNTDGQFGWGMRKNSPQLMAVVNDFVKTHRVGTAFGNTLVTRYAKSIVQLKNATSAEDRKRFDDTAQLFKKYSDQYGMDYLLMMAEGYQESALNQSAKSPVGAVGIMQLMPTTGAQMKVGDIHDVEANIHAGVKYIRFMVDQYFAKEPMTDVNKILFAFAAYNCGPGRVGSLRKEAAAKGFDANKWIDNVEMIAAARIGTETVTYVSNIYKYYIAYKLLADQEAERQKSKEAIQQKNQ